MFTFLLCAQMSFGAGPSRVSLNSASEAELSTLDEVSADEARAIVKMRSARGRLNSVEELRAISGMDESTLASLRLNTSIDILVPIDAPTLTFSNPNDVLAQFANEPTIQQVQSWANEYANTSPDKVRTWLRQSAAFAALPELQLEWKMTKDWDQGFYYYDADGVEGTVPDTKLFPVINDADQGEQQYYKVRLTWDLNELVMSSERIRVINEAQDIVKLRDKILSEITRLYFERRRVQVERMLSPKTDMLARVKEELRLMELTANIDALTGGAFSASMGR